MSPKRERHNGRGLSPPTKNLLAALAVFLLIFMAWLRLPPRAHANLANNAEAKKALMELKNAKRINDRRHSSMASRERKQVDDDLVNDVEEAYNEEIENIAIETVAGGSISEELEQIDIEDAEDAQSERDDQVRVQNQPEPERDTRDKPVVRSPNKWDIDPNDAERKYFVFQPSGGWGNQRMILRWAMRLANAMDRTLIVPMVAPHNKMWYGYDRLNATDMIPADEVLDMDALEAGTVKGVRVHRDHLRTLPSILPGTWKRNSRRSTIWLKENAIKAKWRWRTERVIFWNRGSMWECCAAGTLMTPYVMFNTAFKAFALDLTNTYFGKGVRYNAVHIRRGGGHTRIDRRTSQHYYEMKLQPAGFERNIPIYVATDEKNKTWFSYLNEAQMLKLVFWDDLTRSQGTKVRTFLSRFPKRTHNDVIGFLEQLICGNAGKWTGSDGSTFSYSIDGIRHFSSLRDVNWKENMDATAKRIYAHDGKGIAVSSSESDAEAALERQAELNGSNVEEDEAEESGDT